MTDFLEEAEMETFNGRMVYDLIDRISATWDEEMPQEYKRCKPSSIAGLLQVRSLQYLRCLVDGSHWQGQKKLKKPNKSGKGGHLGCSEGFNFNLYKVFHNLLPSSGLLFNN